MTFRGRQTKFSQAWRIVPEGRQCPPGTVMSGQHWFGGEIGPVCPGCQRAMWVIANLDVSNCGVPVLAKMNRLKIVSCFRCVAEVGYSVAPNGDIRIIRWNGEYQGDDFPYDNYPAEIPKRESTLVAVPAEIDEITKVYLDAGYKQRAKIDLAIKVIALSWLDDDICFVRHQLGGELILMQEEWGPECPDARCRIAGSGDMVALAAIHDDPHFGVPLVSECDCPAGSESGRCGHGVQLITYLCEACGVLFSTQDID